MSKIVTLSDLEREESKQLKEALSAVSQITRELAFTKLIGRDYYAKSKELEAKNEEAKQIIKRFGDTSDKDLQARITEFNKLTEYAQTKVIPKKDQAEYKQYEAKLLNEWDNWIASEKS